MIYILLILIFFIFVVPYSINKEIYLFDKPSFKKSKIINILWCIFLIWYISIQGDNLKTIITDFEFFKTKYLIQTGILNEWLVFSNKIIEIVLNFYLIIIVFSLVRRDAKSRKKFLYIIPLLFIVNTLEAYRILLVNFNEQITLRQSILFPLLVPILIFVPLFLTYSSKSFKNMMTLNNGKIKELIIKKVNGSA